MRRKIALTPNQALNVFAGDPLQHILKYLKPAEAAQLINSSKQIKLKASNIGPLVRENYLLVRTKLATALEITQDELNDEIKLSQAQVGLLAHQKCASRVKCSIGVGILLGLALILLGNLIDMSRDSQLACEALGLFLIAGPAFLCLEEFIEQKCYRVNGRVQTVQNSVRAVSLFKRVLGTRVHQEQQPLLESDEENEEENNLNDRNDII